MRTLIGLIVVALIFSAGLSYADEIEINISNIDTSYFHDQKNLKEMGVLIRTVKGIEIEKQNRKYCGFGWRMADSEDGPPGRVKDRCKDGYVFQEVLEKRFFFELAPVAVHGEISVTVESEHLKIGEEIVVRVFGSIFMDGYTNPTFSQEWTVKSTPVVNLEITEWRERRSGEIRSRKVPYWTHPARRPADWTHEIQERGIQGEGKDH
jgi:hypothetical protein